VTSYNILMQFANDSGFIIKRLLPSFGKCRQQPPAKQMRGIIEKIYADFVKGENYYRTRIPQVKANVRSNDSITHGDMFGHYFVPESVRGFIQENGVHQLEYRCVILERNITIRIMLFSKNELMNMEKYEGYVSFMCIWLYICIRHASNASCKSLTIYLYPTRMKKQLPPRKEQHLGVGNVNSALTSRCARNTGEIIIYREEEWRKVFIHETFHTFCFDIEPHMERDIHAGLSGIFPIRSIFSASEAYAETWARIMNAAYASYESTRKNKEGLKQFTVYFNFSLQMERMFSLLQMNKILGFQDMNYDNLLLDKSKSKSNSKSNSNSNSKTRKRKQGIHIHPYQEDPNTNVFGYFVLSGILMSGYSDFLIWCQTHNTNLFKFSKVSSAVSGSFVKLIEKCRSKEQCKMTGVFGAGNRDKFLSNTTRMSIIELS
jgi:hypothetical protein